MTRHPMIYPVLSPESPMILAVPDVASHPEGQHHLGIYSNPL